MNRFIIVALACACVLFPPLNSHSIESPGLMLEASLDSGAYMQDTPVTLTMILRNEGSDTLKVFSHVATHETHLDPFQVQLRPRKSCIVTKPSKQGRILRLTDERDKSAPVYKNLRTDDYIRHQVNLQAWALRGINGKKLIRQGCYDLTVSYTVHGQEGIWNGTLHSEPVHLVISPRP